MPDTIEIALSARPEFVAAVRHVFHALGVLSELPPEALEDMKLAVSEAVTNALTRQTGREEDVRVVATRDDRGVTVEVADTGPPLNPSALEDPDPLSPDSQEFSFETGLSVPLIRGLVEDIDFVAGPEGGLTVRFAIPAEAGPE